MTTVESLAHITDAITATNAALSVYDSLTERAAIAEEAIAGLETDIAAIHRNDAGQDARARGREFANANSALALAQGDLKSLQDSLLTQKALTVTVGKAAAQAVFEARDVLQTQRVANVSEQLSEKFDWSALPGVRLQGVALAHKSVRALEAMGVSQLYFQVQHDDSFVIGAVRHLDAHWAELKPLLESEPGLELNIPAVVVPPIAKPKPAIVGNQLGIAA